MGTVPIFSFFCTRFKIKIKYFRYYTKEKEIDILFTEEKKYEVIEAKVVGGNDIHAYNTFENPENVVEKDFEGYIIDNNKMKAMLPAGSVVEIRIK